MIVGSSHSDECQIVAVGRRRDGGTKFWCLKHRADATAKYGKPAAECRRAHTSESGPSKRISIDTAMYSGGLALWGAVPPIYDTTTRAMDRGIHVHARKTPNGQKSIDETFQRVDVIHEGNRYPIDELDAIYFMVSTVFGFPVKSLLCNKCGYSHLDKDWFSVHPHQVHLCAGCGRKFRDEERAVGNPVGVVREITGMIPPPSKPAKRTIEIKQEDYQGGLQIWASNPAILWSSKIAPESGIHIHAFKLESDQTPMIDETYRCVVIDGHNLIEDHVRTFMAQSAMPHIDGRIQHLQCQCGKSVYSRGRNAYTPSVERRCENCGQEVRSNSRLKKVIANPVLQTLELLSHTAVRPLRRHNLQLLVEAP